MSQWDFESFSESASQSVSLWVSQWACEWVCESFIRSVSQSVRFFSKVYLSQSVIQWVSETLSHSVSRRVSLWAFNESVKKLSLHQRTFICKWIIGSPCLKFWYIHQSFFLHDRILFFGKENAWASFYDLRENFLLLFSFFCTKTHGQINSIKDEYRSIMFYF